MYWQRYRYFHMNSLISSLLLACFLMTLTRLARPFAFNFLTKFNRSVKVLSTAASKVDTSANPMIFSKYDVVEVSEIEEYSLQATLFRHKKSGAQVMSVKAADENKVFGITFRTPPKDSKGIPHILEHSVLCGSRKFPVKEPFVDLLRGSLQNFLNAFTYPDRTCYPVASTNLKDFYNLAHVYLDAVFYPRAINDPQVLQQEGWHFELEKPSDPLTFKGVVYNEMKGVYSSPDSLLDRTAKEALFPDNTYGVDSGGDPVDIPDLTFQQFKDFHSSYYHPSNSRIFFYGNDDVSKRLELLDEYLGGFDAIKVDSTVEFQSKNLKPLKLEKAFPLSAGSEPKRTTTVNWLLNDKPLSAKERLALGVLDDLLLGTSSAILRKTLIESQLGESVTGGGLSDELLQATFSVGLKGVKAENTQKVEDLVLSSLKKIAETGFEQTAIDASLNTLEFRLREFNTGSFPRGLSVMLGMMSQWIYDGSPVDAVRFEEPLRELKQELKEGKPVFQDLLKKYITSNEHRVTVEMKPVEGLEVEQNQEEVNKLAKIKESLSVSDVEAIIESTKKLKEAQLAEDSEAARQSIPRLGLEDLEPKAVELPLTIIQDGKSDNGDGLTILAHEVPSNGILYLDLALDYSDISDDDLPYLGLFSRMVLESGTSKLDSVALSRKIGTETGGISTSYYSDVKHKSGVIVDPDDVLLYFVVRGKAVYDKIDNLLELVTEVLFDANLGNQKRAVEMLKESKVRKQSSVISSGHTYAATRMSSKRSFLGHLGEITGGLTSVRDAGKLLDQAEKDWPAVQKHLQKIRDTLLKRNSAVINLTADARTLQAAQTSINSLVQKLPKNPSTIPLSESPLLKSWHKIKRDIDSKPRVNEGFVMPSQVNYVGKSASIYKPGEPISSATTVVSRFLSTGYMWDNVRVVGGAYGGFAKFSESSGNMVYLSYRDPNLYKTLQVYDAAADNLLNAEVHAEDILQAVVGSVGDLDSPLSPDQKGFASMCQYLVGETAADRQKSRDEVLGTSASDFKTFAERLKNVNTDGVSVVFGSQAALDQANADITDASKKFVLEPAFTDTA